MSLFKTDDIRDYAAPAVEQAGAVTVALLERVLMGKRNDKVGELFTELIHDSLTSYVSAGLWSMHDLLFRILELTGPARVTFATWSMTQEPVTMLVNALHEGLILELNGLLDVRVKVRNPKVYQFAKMQFGKVRESVCHAKVTVIENDRWAVTINGSPNFTNNPRIEAGDVIVSRAIAEFHRTWIMKEIEKAHPFDDEPNT